MAPTICDGDVVCIRSQPEVEQGQIAAVRIGEEATLKHCYYQNGVVQLIADNPSVCPPMVYTGPDLEDIAIEGLAVGFCPWAGVRFIDFFVVNATLILKKLDLH